MADLPSALFMRLKTNTKIAGLVETKIYSMIVPQGKELPYIRLQYPSNTAIRHLQGDTGLRAAWLQVDCFAKTFKASWQLAEAARDALLDPATAGGVAFVTAEADPPVPERGEDTPEGYIHWTRVDLRIWHRLV